jgi:imidazolonepropionase-like amidohydrolase
MIRPISPKPVRTAALRRLLALASAACVLLAGHVPGARAESVLITGATVHTVSGPVLQPGQIWFRDGRIAGVGEKVDAPGAQVLDRPGMHVYPGVIASSTLLGLTEINAVRATRDTTEVGQFTPDVQSWIAVNPDSELIPVARANGITHIVPTPQGGIVAGQSALVALHGWTTEQMTAVKPLALHVDWPEMQLDLTPKEQLRDRSKWKSPEDLAKERRKPLAELESFFQEARAYARARQATPPAALNPPWEAMLPFLGGERPVIVRADDLRQIRAAVAWAGTTHLRLVISGGRDAALAAPLLASNRVAVIFEHVFDRGLRDTEPYDFLFASAATLQKAGVLVALSAGVHDMAEADIRNLPYHAAQAVAYGLPAAEALRMITLNPARILGVEDRLGSLETGKEATLVLANGDLLDIRSNVKELWMAGQPVSLETRHTRLYEKYRNRPRAR